MNLFGGQNDGHAAAVADGTGNWGRRRKRAHERRVAVMDYLFEGYDPIPAEEKQGISWAARRGLAWCHAFLCLRPLRRATDRLARWMGRDQYGSMEEMNEKANPLCAWLDDMTWIFMLRDGIVSKRYGIRKTINLFGNESMELMGLFFLCLYAKLLLWRKVVQIL